jgi:hypothetical protein
MSNKPILFYSPNCKHSIHLWNRLKQSNTLDKITKINVNKNRSIPTYIKSVPTLIVKGRPPLTGQSIEMFLNSCQNTTSNTPTKQVQTTNDNEGIQDYMPTEMGSSWSDGYSYIDETKPINHSYSFLEQTNTPSITNINVKQDTKNNKGVDLAQRLEEFKNARDNDFTNSRNR